MIALFALAAALPAFEVQVTVPPPVYVPPSPPPPYSINLDTLVTAVNPVLSGGGTLTLPRNLPPELTQLGLFSSGFELTVSKTGAITGCTTKYVYPSGAAATEVCAHIMRTARYSFAPGIAIPTGEGIINAWGRAGPIATIALPVTFLPKDKGTAVAIYYRPADARRPAYCNPSIEGRLIRDAESKAICSTFEKTATFRLKKGTDGIAFGGVGESTKINAWLAEKPEPSSAIFDWDESAGISNYSDKYVYPPGTLEKTVLTRDQGSFAAAVTDQDYPPVARDLRLQGVSAVQAIIVPDGSVQGCNPIESNAGLLLDAQACAILRKSGRFTFANGTTIAKPVGYRVTVRWRIMDIVIE